MLCVYGTAGWCEGRGGVGGAAERLPSHTDCHDHEEVGLAARISSASSSGSSLMLARGVSGLLSSLASCAMACSGILLRVPAVSMGCGMEQG